MRSAASLIALVREIIDDTHVSDSAILAWMNEALNSVAERVTPTTLMVPFKQFDIYAGEQSVELPEEAVPEKVLSVHDQDMVTVPLYFRIPDAEAAFKANPTPSNVLRAVLVIGNSLRLIPTPSTDTFIYLSFVRYPDVFQGISDTGEAITFLPAGMAEKLVVNYAAAMAYRLIEDGVTDKRLNFQTYFLAAREAFAEIEEYFAARSKQARPEQVGGTSLIDQIDSLGAL